MSRTEPSIAVFGAGAIGCWVGGKLAAAGASVTLIGRARVIGELAHGLRVTDLDGGEATCTPQLTTEPHAAAAAELVLVTVKSAQTAEAGETLARVLPEGRVVVSLQNGLRNAEILRAALPGRRILAAMVPFNVVRRGPGAYHRASGGSLRIDDDPAAAPLVAACRAAKLPIELRRDMPAVQWAKLVMNLNNAINALSGLPLATELAQRAFRRCLSAAQREALELLALAHQEVAKLTPIPPRWMPRLLDVPDPVFRLLASRVVAIDPHARSSMWDDLEAGRPTEIDQLQGEVVALAERRGRTAPVNRALVRLVREAEAGGRRDYSGVELRSALGL
ncbi:MAG: putative 2-dehydropantoate 2-reductase [Deltaproteobacteria bacterium]|nr:putative 2-dehydropantoate 2-reductase [Deltaproteobacteria bacterium]